MNREGFMLKAARFRRSWKDQRLLCRADKTTGRHAPTPGIPKRRRKPCALACSRVASRAADKHASMLCQRGMLGKQFVPFSMRRIRLMTRVELPKHPHSSPMRLPQNFFALLVYLEETAGQKAADILG